MGRQLRLLLLAHELLPLVYLLWLLLVSIILHVGVFLAKWQCYNIWISFPWILLHRLRVLLSVEIRVLYVADVLYLGKSMRVKVLDWLLLEAYVLGEHLMFKRLVTSSLLYCLILLILRRIEICRIFILNKQLFCILNQFWRRSDLLAVLFQSLNELSSSTLILELKIIKVLEVAGVLLVVGDLILLCYSLHLKLLLLRFIRHKALLPKLQSPDLRAILCLTQIISLLILIIELWFRSLVVFILVGIAGANSL